MLPIFFLILFFYLKMIDFLSIFVILIVVLLLIFLFSDADLTLTLCLWFCKAPNWYFSGKVVWIVGASSGIGEALAYRLAKCHCRLILSARRAEELQRVKVNCLESNWDIREDDIFVLPLDLTEFSAHKETAKKAQAVFGQLDIIILNAGRSQRADWLDVEPDVDLDCFRLNALGPTVLARAILPHLLAQPNGGHFVVVSSISGLIGAPLSPSYSAAKHALNGYFRCLYLEYYAKNIKVTITCPGSTFSPNNVLNAYTSKQNESHGELMTEPTSGHMTTERAAQLICVSAANNLAETWFSRIRPIRIMTYLGVLYPLLQRAILLVIGPEKLRKMREAK